MHYFRELDAALQVARQAGLLALQLQSGPLTRKPKPDGSIVTNADPEVEKFIYLALHQDFPNDSFLGEESPEVIGTSGRRWIVDPIDGTLEFELGETGWTVMIALEDQGAIELGVIRDPTSQEMLYALKDWDAWMIQEARHSQLRIPPWKDRLSAATLLYRNYSSGPFRPDLAPLLERVGRHEGRDDVFALVSGKADILVVQGLERWDIAAPSVIVREAGGIAEVRGGLFIAANPHLFARVIETLGLNE